MRIAEAIVLNPTHTIQGRMQAKSLDLNFGSATLREDGWLRYEDRMSGTAYLYPPSSIIHVCCIEDLK